MESVFDRVIIKLSSFIQLNSSRSIPSMLFHSLLHYDEALKLLWDKIDFVKVRFETSGTTS